LDAINAPPIQKENETRSTEFPFIAIAFPRGIFEDFPRGVCTEKRRTQQHAGDEGRFSLAIARKGGVGGGRGGDGRRL
jgi:hypothetical protein